MATEQSTDFTLIPASHLHWHNNCGLQSVLESVGKRKTGSLIESDRIDKPRILTPGKTWRDPERSSSSMMYNLHEKINNDCLTATSLIRIFF